MKKILLLFLSILTFISCTDTYRSDDFFIVISKEKRNIPPYKYLYGVNHYMASAKEGSFRSCNYRASTKDGTFFLGYCSFVSNENYELGDTIKFIRYTSNKK